MGFERWDDDKPAYLPKIGVTRIPCIQLHSAASFSLAPVANHVRVMGDVESTMSDAWDVARPLPPRSLTARSPPENLPKAPIGSRIVFLCHHFSGVNSLLNFGGVS